MALRDEHADILGGPIIQRPESGLFATYPSVFKSAVLLGLGLLVWIVCARGLEHLRKHRELRHRKAMRRKHGIPDSDCRPFAVAYAAAKRAHLEREAQGRKKMTNYVSDHNLPVVDQRTDAERDARGLRRRVPESTVQPHNYQLPGKYAAAYDDMRAEAPLDFADRYNPNPRYRPTVPEHFSVERLPVRRASRKDLVINIERNEESRKRTLEDEGDIEHETMKKSRIERNELKGVEERPDWYAQLGDLAPQQVSRESLGGQPADNYVYVNGLEKRKRVNGTEDDVREPADEAMEGIDEDGVTELEAVARGKKRDWTEAGSSFGGDDDEDIRNGRVLHHRKRRTILRRKVDVPARGQKRDREAESPESDEEEGGSEASRRRSQRSSKKKRGKESAFDEEVEISVEDPRISKDPLCGGRRVGDEWEAGGAQYKVGEKGERLRLTLVKKARNKYHMPKDSQHPDRSAALEIYVETWMTDEQYKCAEERQELAWQEAPRELSRSGTPDVVDSPTTNGKNLLWDSIKGSPARHSFRQLMPTGASTRINPFEQLQPTLGRRVTSSSAIVSSILPGVTDSPTRPGFRGFSKWEKQDREAEALARIRAKIEEQKKAQVPLQKLVEVSTSASAPELGTKSLTVPTITLTPAPVVAVGGQANNSNTSQNKPNTLASFATTPSTDDATKGAAVAVSTTASGFSSPSTSTPSAASSIFPSALTAPTATSTALSHSPFSFAKSPQVPLSTSITTLPYAVSNPFEKGSGSGTPSATAPSAPTLGIINQSQPPVMENASKPQSPLAKPNAFTFTSPTVTSSATTKSQAPHTSGSPSVNFESNPPTAKAEVPAPRPVSTSISTPENLKPTVPLFSFSGASSSLSTGTLQASSSPKFSFGRPPTTSTFASSSDLAFGATPQPQPTFKFGQTPPSAKDGSPATVVLAGDEAKRLAVPVSVFGSATGSNELVNRSPFETTLVSLTDTSAKPVTADGGALTSTLPMPTVASMNSAATNSMFPSTFSGTPASSNAPVFTFGGTNSGSKPGEGSKPPSLFGVATGGSGPSLVFGGSSTEKKPTFTFPVPAESSKPIIFGGNSEGLKPPSVFGGSAGGNARSRGGM